MRREDRFDPGESGRSRQRHEWQRDRDNRPDTDDTADSRQSARLPKQATADGRQDTARSAETWIIDPYVLDVAGNGIESAPDDRYFAEHAPENALETARDPRHEPLPEQER